jgi:siroheme synthase-like protein
MLRLDGKRCVVIGGGKVAVRKVARLVEAGALVTVIAPSIDPLMARVERDGNPRRESRPYKRGDLVGAALAFAATDSHTVNAAVADEAAELGVPVNVSDDPAASTFHVPASFERQGLTLAISTGGRSPAFARRLREELEHLLTPERISLLELYAEVREDLPPKERPANGSAWTAADDEVLRMLKDGRRAEARQVLRQHLQAAARRGG